MYGVMLLLALCASADKKRAEGKDRRPVSGRAGDSPAGHKSAVAARDAVNASSWGRSAALEQFDHFVAIHKDIARLHHVVS